LATGGYVCDLEVGDRIGPVEYTMSAFVVREYSHANELHHDFLQGIDDPLAPPTLIHLDKLRLYRHGCPKGTGPRELRRAADNALLIVYRDTSILAYAQKSEKK